MKALAACLLVLAVPACAANAKTVARRPAEATPGPSVAELLDRGRGFAAVGDLTRAEQYFSAALEAGADPKRTVPLLVHVCVEAKRYRVASDYVQQELRRDPEDASLRLLHGLLEASVGNRAVALHEYKLVLDGRPDDSESHYAMAVLLRDGLDDAVGASEHFRAYLRLSPDGVHAGEARASLLEGRP
jgi:tetratricopeptide (TPR) repeat protein